MGGDGHDGNAGAGEVGVPALLLLDGVTAQGPGQALFPALVQVATDRPVLAQGVGEVTGGNAGIVRQVDPAGLFEQCRGLGGGE